MALSFNGSTSNLKRTGSPVSAYPIALFCWVKTTTANRGEMIFGVGSTATGTDELMAYHDSADDKMVAFAKDNTQSYKASSTTAASTSWTPLLAVFASSSSRTVYYGAGAKVTDTTAASVALGSLDRIVVGQRGITDTLQFLGDIAELAIWAGTVPGDTEWAALAAGAAPETIMNASLVDAWSLQTQAATQTGAKGLVLTATSTSQAGTHPPVTHSSAPILSTPAQGLTAVNRTTAGATIDSGGVSGTMYALARTGGSAALAAAIKSGGQSNATTGNGAKTVPNTVLATGTANQFVDLVYNDATNGDSNVVTVGPITTAAAVAVGSSSAQSGTQGTAFSWSGATPAAGTTGGFGSVGFTLGAGSLPSGVSVNPTTGTLQGTPAASGTFSGIQIRGTDSGSPTSTALAAAFTLTVAASGGGGVKVPAVLLSRLLTPRS